MFADTPHVTQWRYLLPCRVERESQMEDVQVEPIATASFAPQSPRERTRCKRISFRIDVSGLWQSAVAECIRAPHRGETARDEPHDRRILCTLRCAVTDQWGGTNRNSPGNRLGSIRWTTASGRAHPPWGGTSPGAFMPTGSSRATEGSQSPSRGGVSTASPLRCGATALGIRREDPSRLSSDQE